MKRIRRTELTKRGLETIDRVFLVLFGRFRRKLGDANIEVAWHSASFRVSGYMALASAATLFVLFVVIQSFTRLSLASEYRRGWQILAGVLALSVALLLDRRFKKYLSVPPALATKESREEKLLVIWFRAITIGTFALICVAAIVLHEFGLNF